MGMGAALNSIETRQSSVSVEEPSRPTIRIPTAARLAAERAAEQKRLELQAEEEAKKGKSYIRRVKQNNNSDFMSMFNKNNVKAKPQESNNNG